VRWSRCPSGGRSGGRRRGWGRTGGPIVPLSSRVPSPRSSCARGLPVPQVFPAPQIRTRARYIARNLRFRARECAGDRASGTSSSLQAAHPRASPGSSSRIGNFLRPKSEHAPDISGASSDFGRGSGARRGEAMAIGLWRRQAHVSVSAAPAASVQSGGDTACSCRSLAGPTQPPCSSRCSRTREPAHCAVRR